MTRGKIAFADNCARCHSSKTVPPPVPASIPNGCAGKDYLQCWNTYWEWTQTQAFKDKMRPIVLAKDFLDDNYLSAEFRVPVTLLQTNACSPLATNAIKDNIWDNFSSADLQGAAVGRHHHVVSPVHRRAARPTSCPAGGRGYTLPPSLRERLVNGALPPQQQRRPLRVVAVGRGAPAIVPEVRSNRLLWPERREKDSLLGDKIPGRIDRTTRDDVSAHHRRLPA